ncbi:NepR family anti-sigma factor [uncultured Sphingomonas sp.]|uniref:NepR family anti-sigma factor n=1 Tax=uncultured Sphingomonas sp. TaxID=158754 RepID=UPI0035C97980
MSLERCGYRADSAGGYALNPDKKTSVNKPATSRQPMPGTRDREVGEALRSVYDKAVQESVPDEMLDLLSKLD